MTPDDCRAGTSDGGSRRRAALCGWRQEGLLRMLENVLEIGERPEDLVVYAARAKAARDWAPSPASLPRSGTVGGRDARCPVRQADRRLPQLAGRPFGGDGLWERRRPYATQEYFEELTAAGLIMWGGLTAATGSTSASRASCRGLRAAAGCGAGALRRLSRRTARAHGRPRRHGSAQPLAIAMAAPVASSSRSTTLSAPGPSAADTSTPSPTTSTRRSPPWRSRPGRRESSVSSGTRLTSTASSPTGQWCPMW